MAEHDTASRAGGRRLWPVCALVFGAALAIRVAYAYTRPIPVSRDAAYYLMVARNLDSGRGFVSDYVWNYLAGLPQGLPVPSNEYWMPGTSVVMAGAFAIAREASLRAAQWPALVFGALLCAITAWIAGAISGRRSAAALAGAAAAANYYLVELTLYPDHFMLNAVLANLSLLALWRAWRGGAWLAAPAGALAGLAYLTRTDGALLCVAALLLAIGSHRRAKRGHSLRLGLYFVAAFAIIAAPWWARQYLVFGHPSGADPLRTVFLTSYDDLFRLDQSHLNLADYLSAGQAVAVKVKGQVLVYSLRILAKAVVLVGALALIGLGMKGLRREAAPWLIYLVLGVVAPPLLVPYVAGKGGLWHLLPALMPIVLALGMAAAVRVVEHTISRRGLAAAGVLLAAVTFASPLCWWLVRPGSGDSGPLYPPVAAEAVRALGPDAGPVLTDDAWGLNYITGVRCAQFPSDGEAAALKVADAIGARYLITRADAPSAIPAIGEVLGHPSFRPLARYPIGETSLLVYRIVPATTRPRP